MTEQKEWSYREQFKRNARHQMNNGHLKEPIVTMAETVKPEKIQWIWPGRLARGKITLLEGDPGLGKSTLTIEIAARLSRGEPLPGGLPLPPTGTLFLSAEDGVADTIVPRLIEAQADLTRIRILEGIKHADGDAGVTIPYDLDTIEAVMAEHGCSLVVVDPLSVFLGDDINENKNQEVRKALAPAKAMLERARVAGLFLRHLTKSQSATPVYRGAGSIGLGGAARAVMMVGEDPELTGVRVLATVKENLSAPTPSLSYRVISSPSNPDVAAIDWMGFSSYRAADLQGGNDQEETGRLAEAKEWLLDYLRGGVMVKARQVYKDAKADGHAERTIDRAKKLLGVRSIKNPVDGTWAWNLPLSREECQPEPPREPNEGSQPLAHDHTLGTLGDLPKNTHNNNVFIDTLQMAPFEGSHGTLGGDSTITGMGAESAKDAGAYTETPVGGLDDELRPPF